MFFSVYLSSTCFTQVITFKLLLFGHKICTFQWEKIPLQIWDFAFLGAEQNDDYPGADIKYD